MATESERLEQQARQIRARMSETAEALRDRLSTGQLLNQVTDYAWAGPPAEVFHNLVRETRENPLPVAFVAIGVAWLIIASNRSARIRMESRARTGAADDRCKKELLLPARIDESAGPRAMEQAHEPR
jgi:hypothetical protein